MSVDDYGKDLAGVQALQRKQEDVERDMTALQTQLEVWLLKIYIKFLYVSKYAITQKRHIAIACTVGLSHSRWLSSLPIHEY